MSMVIIGVYAAAILSVAFIGALYVLNIKGR